MRKRDLEIGMRVAMSGKWLARPWDPEALVRAVVERLDDKPGWGGLPTVTITCETGPRAGQTFSILCENLLGEWDTVSGEQAELRRARQREIADATAWALEQPEANVEVWDWGPSVSAAWPTIRDLFAAQHEDFVRIAADLDERIRWFEADRHKRGVSTHPEAKAVIRELKAISRRLGVRDAYGQIADVSISTNWRKDRAVTITMPWRTLQVLLKGPDIDDTNAGDLLGALFDS